MRYVAAYMLARLGGNASPKAQDIKKILSSVGIDADDASITKVISELNGKDIDELITSGNLTFLMIIFRCWLKFYLRGTFKAFAVTEL